jgi:hypothetical protein
MKDIIEVTIGFDTNREKIKYIKSDFLDEQYSFKDPVGYTARLIEMGLEYWIREKIGIFCPECSTELQEGWSFCPSCGWNHEKGE